MEDLVDINMEEASVLKSIRGYLGMTQQRFAGLLDTSRSHIAMMERGKRRLSSDQIQALSVRLRQQDISREVIETVIYFLKTVELSRAWDEVERKAEDLNELIEKPVIDPTDFQTVVDMRFEDRGLTLNTPTEQLIFIEFLREIAMRKLYQKHWASVEEIVGFLYGMMTSASDRECRKAAVESLLIILSAGIPKRLLNRGILDKIFNSERQFEIMVNFGDLRVSELDLLRVKSLRNELSLGDMEYYSPRCNSAIDLDSRRRRSTGIIDFRTIGEEPRVEIAKRWTSRIINGEPIEKMEIAHLFRCLHYIFPPTYKKQVINVLLDNLQGSLSESDRECALWEQWQLCVALEPYIPFLDDEMRDRLELLKDECSNEVVRLGAEMILATKITKDHLKKISLVAVDEICLSERQDVKTSHVYIYTGYELSNFIQRFLNESREILPFDAIQGIIEQILRGGWLPPKISVPMIISSVYHRLSDTDVRQAHRILGEFLDDTKQSQELEEVRSMRSLAESIMRSLK